MLKADYAEIDRIHDVRILAGWGESKDLKPGEQERLDLARTRLAILTAAEIIPVIAKIVPRMPLQAPLHRDPVVTGRPEYSEPPPHR